MARLYGYNLDVIQSSKQLTNELDKVFSKNQIAYRRGIHWTTDAGYMETWGQICEYRQKGALCVEMEGGRLIYSGSISRLLRHSNLCDF